MNVLLTGGAGFIGSHLADTCLGRGDEVTVVDNFTPFYPREVKRRNLEHAFSSDRFHLVEADIRDLDALRDGLSGTYDVIVHLAASAGVRPSIQDPVGYQDVNVIGTQNMLELARERQIEQFVFASSSSVYGVNPDVPWKESDSVLQPISPYASTKVSGELLGHVYSHLYGIRFIALRFFTVYGPRQRPDLAIHKFARLARSRTPIQMYGDGTTRRDYTYVDDIVSGIESAMAYKASPFEIINLGNNRTVSLRDLIDLLQSSMGVEFDIEHLPEQPGDVPQTWADISKAKALLGYAPSTSIEAGLKQFADWFLKDHAVARP